MITNSAQIIFLETLFCWVYDVLFFFIEIALSINFWSLSFCLLIFVLFTMSSQTSRCPFFTAITNGVFLLLCFGFMSITSGSIGESNASAPPSDFVSFYAEDQGNFHSVNFFFLGWYWIKLIDLCEMVVI